MMARMLLALAAVAAIFAAPSAAFGQATPSNPARAALAALERQADALFAAAAKRDWTGAKIALDGAKGAVDVLRTQRFEGPYADAGGRMEALYAARHRLDTAVAEADIALGVTDGPSAMRSANRLTEIVWQLGAPIDPPLVHQAQRLAFLARKLEYALAVGDKAHYAETVGGGPTALERIQACTRRAQAAAGSRSDRRRDCAAWPRRARGCRSGEAARGGGAIAANDTWRMTTMTLPTMRCVFAAAVLTIAGCASTNVSTIPFPNVGDFPPTEPARVQILRAEPARPHVKLGEITLDASSSPPPTAQEIDGMLRDGGRQARRRRGGRGRRHDSAGTPRCERDLVGPHALSRAAREVVAVAVKYR